jgi:hypothetical protein
MMAKASLFTLPYNIKQVCKYADVTESRSYYLFVQLEQNGSTVRFISQDFG